MVTYTIFILKNWVYYLIKSKHTEKEEVNSTHSIRLLIGGHLEDLHHPVLMLEGHARQDVIEIEFSSINAVHFQPLLGAHVLLILLFLLCLLSLRGLCGQSYTQNSITEPDTTAWSPFDDSVGRVTLRIQSLNQTQLLGSPFDDSVGRVTLRIQSLNQTQLLGSPFHDSVGRVTLRIQSLNQTQLLGADAPLILLILAHSYVKFDYRSTFH